MDSFKKRKKSFLYKYRPGQIMVLGFAGVILAGTLILMLPISSNSGEVTNFFDCLFTATSSVCVTGLVVLDTSLHWSVFGKAVIILLIQIGGMGFMSIGALISFIFGTKINIRKRMLLQESLNQNQLSGVVRLIRRVLIFTVSIEFVGALLLSVVFIPRFGLIDGIGYSIFHSISAFCNAGFDLMGRHSGEFSSMLMFYNNSIVVLNL
ncbi:MAG: potassium transporter TrkG [Peptostreptococcus porci]|nr:potassium transporter TrkG [Peptostreptococcus porci]MDD7183472.1 potassium transporter TrkG [Peptostreptococcus porci]